MGSIATRNVRPTHEEIAVCAYFIYLSEGCPAGKEAEHWSQAEDQLLGDRIDDAVRELTIGEPISANRSNRGV